MGWGRRPAYGGRIPFAVIPVCHSISKQRLFQRSCPSAQLGQYLLLFCSLVSKVFRNGSSTKSGTISSIGNGQWKPIDGATIDRSLILQRSPTQRDRHEDDASSFAGPAGEQHFLFACFLAQGANPGSIRFQNGDRKALRLMNRVVSLCRQLVIISFSACEWSGCFLGLPQIWIRGRARPWINKKKAVLSK